MTMIQFNPLVISGLTNWAVGTFGELGGALVMIVLGLVALYIAVSLLAILLQVLFIFLVAVFGKGRV